MDSPDGRPPAGTRRSRAWLPALGVLVAVALAFRDVLSPARGLFFGDHLLHFRPRWFYIREALLAGRLPALTPADPFGTPTEAVVNATYTPVTLLALLGRFDVAYDHFVIGFFVVLAAGAYAFARGLGADRPAAAGAALVAALSGPVLSLQAFPNILAGAAFAPWCYEALRRLLVRPTLPAAGALGLALSFHAQGIIPELLALDLVVAVALVVRLRPRPGLRLAALAALAGVLGLAGAAIELAPALGQLAGRRAGGFDYAEASRFSLRPAMLLEYLVPDVLAPVEAPFVYLRNVYPPDRGPSYFRSFYASLAPALLLTAALTPRTRRAALWVLGGFGFAVLVALGPSTPLHRWVVSLPVMSLGRFPVKYAVVGVAALAAAIPLGLVAVRENRPAFQRIMILQVALLAVFTSVAHSDPYRALLFNEMGFGGSVVDLDRYAAARVAVALVQVRAWHALAVALVAGALAAKARPAHLGAALVALIGLDLGAAGAYVAVGAEPPPRDLAPLVEDRLEPEERFFAQNIGQAPWAAVEGRTYFDTHIRSQMARGAGLHVNLRRFDDWDAVAQANPVISSLWRAAPRLPADARLRLLGRAGVGLTSSLEPVEGVTSARLPVQGERPFYLVEVPAVRPFVHAFTAWTAVPPRTPPAAVMAAFTSSTTWSVALVHAETAPPPDPDCRDAPRVTWRRAPGAEAIDARVEAECRALVVLLEPFTPRWRARVDGVAADPLMAEGGMLGVFVAPGAHDVRFEYAAQVYDWAPVSAAAWLVAAALIVAGTWRRRRG